VAINGGMDYSEVVNGGARGGGWWCGGMCGKRVTQRPFWTPPFARSLASPYSGQKLAVGNPPSYCKHGVLEDDAGVASVTNS